MDTPSTIDRAAPVVAHHEIDIRAPLDAVWRLHTDVAGWPRWNAAIAAARADGPFAPGASFTWTSYGFTVTSTIAAVAEGRRILWGGTAEGITGIHEWLFAETLRGVRVTTSESFSGRPVEADPARMQALLDASLVAWLAALKAAAESTA